MIQKVALVLVILFAVSCTFQPLPEPGHGPQLGPAPSRPEAVSKREIDGYLGGLDYDPRQILAEQVGDSVLPAKPLPDEEQDDGNAIVIVRQVKHRLSGNLDDLLILDPIHGVVWPGALVKVDQEMVRGTPTPIPCRRAPMWLSVDLPGIGGRGVFAVDDPSNGTVQAAIDQALDYWNDNQYREGYVSKARSKAVFHSSVTLEDVQRHMTDQAPPAYVGSVDYGRILMLRIETSSDTLHTEIEGAMRYLSAQVDVSADYRKTLEKSKVTLITIGGNAEVNTRAVDASRIEDLHELIQGKNALYSKNNPGQPIAYTVRFLKDGRLAKMGYSTDFTEVVCERHPHGWIGFKHSGAYVAKFFMNWKEGDQKLAGPPNKVYVAKGTTLNRKWETASR